MTLALARVMTRTFNLTENAILFLKYILITQYIHKTEHYVRFTVRKKMIVRLNLVKQTLLL